MAKVDFCFTYYDGDAARDMAHMNRLERGGYSDIIISQRKFGHLTLSQLKKILGTDYESCFESIELILKKDEDDKYFIEWLDNSINQMLKHSEHQTVNGKKGGRPKTQNEPNQNPIKTQVDNKKKPLEDEDGDEDEDGFKDKIEDVSERLKKTKPIVIEYPFSENFLSIWVIWKNYKKEQFKFIFKTNESEQAALLDLVKKSAGKESAAIEIINQSMANGWKGLFEIRENSNGQPNSNARQQTGKITGEQLDQAFADFYSPKGQNLTPRKQPGKITSEGLQQAFDKLYR